MRYVVIVACFHAAYSAGLLIGLLAFALQGAASRTRAQRSTTRRGAERHRIWHDPHNASIISSQHLPPQRVWYVPMFFATPSSFIRSYLAVAMELRE